MRSDRIGELELRGLDVRRDLLLKVVSEGQDLEFRRSFRLFRLRLAGDELARMAPSWLSRVCISVRRGRGA